MRQVTGTHTLISKMCITLLLVNPNQSRFLQVALILSAGGATEEQKQEFDHLADQFGEQGITLDYVGGVPMLRAYDDQDDQDNDVFKSLKEG